MKLQPETALAAWAVGTAWLILFVIIEHFDEEGPDVLDYVQWSLLLVAGLLFPFFRKWFKRWLIKSRGT